VCVGRERENANIPSLYSGVLEEVGKRGYAVLVCQPHKRKVLVLNKPPLLSTF